MGDAEQGMGNRESLGSCKDVIASREAAKQSPLFVCHCEAVLFRRGNLN